MPRDPEPAIQQPVLATDAAATAYAAHTGAAVQTLATPYQASSAAGLTGASASNTDAQPIPKTRRTPLDPVQMASLPQSVNNAIAMQKYRYLALLVPVLGLLLAKAIYLVAVAHMSVTAPARRDEAVFYGCDVLFELLALALLVYPGLLLHYEPVVESRATANVVLLPA